MRIRDVTNPFRGHRGFWNTWNKVVFTFMGPAQVGVGCKEAPYVPPRNPSCPLCGEPMAAHRVERNTGNVSTRLHCPID